MIGVTLVYAVSGMLLNRMKNGKDYSYKVKTEQLSLNMEMTKEELSSTWQSQSGLPKLNKIFDAGEGNYRLMIDGGMGLYYPKTGVLDYEISSKRTLIYWINRLHYNKVNGWSIMADIFAISLMFFALSGLIMVKGKKGIAGRGKWYVLVGLAIPVIYVLLTN
jgi:hypothetical protein